MSSPVDFGLDLDNDADMDGAVIVVDSRPRTDGPMLPRNYDAREYWCRNCNVKHISRGFPTGWYVVKKSQGENEPFRTVAVACSLECLMRDAQDELLKRASNGTRY